MILYRLAEPHFSSPQTLFNGIGAGRFGGRWNPIDTRALYCGENSLVCGAELGFHKIISSISLYNQTSSKSEKRKFANDYLIDKRMILTEFELLNCENKILDIADDDLLAKNLKDLNINLSTNWTELRKSAYLLDNDRKSQLIGQVIHDNKYFGFKVKSARCEEKMCVLFPGNIPSEYLNIRQRQKATLSALNISMKKLNPGQRPDENTVLFGIDKNKLNIRVLQL